MADPTDHERWEAAMIGRVLAHDDHDAFTELVRAHQSAVRRFLRRLTAPDWSRADDLAQETFWKAYRHLGSFRARGRFIGWLLRIAYQEFITDLRRRRGAIEVSLDVEPDAWGNPERRLIEGATLAELMASLRPEERAVLELHYGCGLTHPEIAGTLDLPLGTVKTLIRRARLKLRADMTPDT